jgi:hypothetical protein
MEGGSGRMQTRMNDRTEKGVYLFDVGLSLCAVASLGLCIPAPLAIILGGEGGARGVVEAETARVTLFDGGDIMYGNHVK